jgi:hypothetical protein
MAENHYDASPCNYVLNNGEALSKGAAFALPSIGIFLNPHERGKARIDLVRHEFGHILRGAVVGNGNFYSYIVPASLYSATKAHLITEYSHQNFWTEVRANDLSYNYLGRPANWNTNRFPLAQPSLPSPPRFYQAFWPAVKRRSVFFLKQKMNLNRKFLH